MSQNDPERLAQPWQVPVARILARITGALTAFGLLFVGCAWEFERNLNPDPSRVASDYATAAAAVLVVGGLLTLLLALGGHAGATAVARAPIPVAELRAGRRRAWAVLIISAVVLGLALLAR